MSAPEREEARKRLCDACSAVVSAVRDAARHENDHILQHALTLLKSECEWCLQEFCKEGNDAE